MAHVQNWVVSTEVEAEAAKSHRVDTTQTRVDNTKDKVKDKIKVFTKDHQYINLQRINSTQCKASVSNIDESKVERIFHKLI